MSADLPAEDAASDRAAARSRLDAALARVRLRVPCRVDSDSWFAPTAAGRAVAVAACAPCPVLVECGRLADVRGEQFGTWGALDRESLTPRQRQQRARDAR